MRIKNIIAVAASTVIAMSFSSGAFAKTAVFGNINADGNINLSLSSNFGKATYGVYILKPGADIEEINAADTTTDFTGFETINISSDSDEVYQSGQMTFKLDADAEKGVYTLIVGGGELEGHTVKVVYQEEYLSAADELKNASDADAVLKQYQDKAWSLDFSDSAYVNNKTSVIESFKAIMKESEATAEAVTKAFSQACALATLKTCAESEIADNLLVNEELFGLDYSQTVYENPDAIADMFNNLRNEMVINTAAELNRAVTASKAMNLLNTATRDNIIEVLIGYNEIFGLDFEGNYKKVSSYEVAKKIVADDIPYTTLASVKAKFDEAVGSLIAPGSTSGGGSSSGSGSSGGGGGSSTITGGVASAGSYVTPDKLAAMEPQELFNDLHLAEWATPYIKYLSENEIMQGDGQGNFRPVDGILREEFLKLVIEGLDIEPKASEISFSDVSEDAWYKAYVQTGVESGIINGISEENFGAGMQISREDAAVMIKRAAEAANIELVQKADEITFTDGENISDYAKEAVSVLTKAQIINGYETGEFCPQKLILRSEAAKIIYTTIKAMIR